MTDHVTCSASSLEAGDSLIGSAPHRRLWLLLEVDAPWGPQALADSDLPPAVREHIEAFLAGTPDAGVLFIRQQPARAGLRLFLAVGDASFPALYALTLERYEDLLSLDFASLARGERPECRDDEPLYLTCTHGVRDRCCALAGMPMYAALRERVGDRAWRCSHVGGHRFAPTMVFLPEGLCYGRMPLEALDDVLDRHRAGQLEPRWLRGRSAWPQPAQAAATLLRQRDGLATIEGLQLLDLQSDGEERWVVTFDAPGQTSQVRLHRRTGDTTYRSSCIGDKVAASVSWELLPS
ncbi:MAG: hypothetical protein OXG07_12125 [Anaerolineaceae bacterium]|nr:hypothetical protein [Anaerolineaceae bacterium]